MPDPAPTPLSGLDYSVVQQCMHCGMCLPDCPTYRETGREKSSPRGRIALMRAIADGELPVSDSFADEMGYCLGCLACQSACPADVDYARLFEHARAASAESRPLPLRTRFYRALTLRFLFRHPSALRLAGRALRLYQHSGLAPVVRRLGLVPPHLRELEPSAPEIAPAFSNRLVPHLMRPGVPGSHRVALLTGCVQDLAFPSVNRDCAEVLTRAGCTVETPPLQPCCGSLHAHNGDLRTARELAARQLDLFSPLERFDAIITNAGGCGSHLKHYADLLPGDPRAAVWDSKVKDFHEFLSTLPGLKLPTMDAPSAMAVAYHPSCHLHHGQGVRDEPAALLAAIPGISLVSLEDATTCCGAAGIYSITHPESSAALLEEKIRHIIASGCQVIATANPGCQLQLVNGLRERGIEIRVVHPATLLAEALQTGQ